MDAIDQPWKPLPPGEAAALLAGCPVLWWVAGGWALDLFLGHPTREHGDIDVGVSRSDALKVQQHLAGWRLFAVDPSRGLRPWADGEVLEPTVRDIWCRRGPDFWELQLMLHEESGGQWIFRRNPQIRLPLPEVYRTSAAGIRYLRPELQLLFKAKAARPKDHADFARLWPALARAQRSMLRDLLRREFPGGHPWLAEPEVTVAEPAPSR